MMESSQLHAEAAKQSKEIDFMFDSLRVKYFIDSFHGQINQAIRFYGKNLAMLPESNDAILKLAKVFIRTASKKLINWNIRDSNAFLLLVTSVLLKRKDESVVRQICAVLLAFGKIVNEAELKNLARVHGKVMRLILHKMSKVATYFTQQKLLEVLLMILRANDDGGAQVFNSEKLIAKSRNPESAFFFFERLEPKDFLVSSREFLEFYNVEVIPKQFIFSVEGFYIGINSRHRLVHSKITIDFNLRNLSVSFFINRSVLKNFEEKTDEMFIELEGIEMITQIGKFKDPSHIELTLKPSRYQVLDSNDALVDFPQILRVLLVVSDADKVFTNKIYPHFTGKSPMVNDCTLDLESVVSFHTVTSFVNEPFMRSQAQRPIYTQAASKQAHHQVNTQAPPKQAIMTQDLLSDCVASADNAQIIKQVVAQDKKRQTATIVPTQAQKPAPKKNVYDDYRADDDAIPSSYTQYMERMRGLRQGMSQNVEVLEPVPEQTAQRHPKREVAATKKTRAKKSPPPKKPRATRKKAQPKKPATSALELSTDIEDDILEEFGEALKPFTEEDKKIVTKPEDAPKRKPQRKRASTAKVEPESSIDEIMLTHLKSSKPKSAKPRLMIKKSEENGAKPVANRKRKVQEEAQPSKPIAKFNLKTIEPQTTRSHTPKRIKMNTPHSISDDKENIGIDVPKVADRKPCLMKPQDPFDQLCIKSTVNLKTVASSKRLQPAQPANVLPPTKLRRVSFDENVELYNFTQDVSCASAVPQPLPSVSAEKMLSVEPEPAEAPTAIHARPPSPKEVAVITTARSTQEIMPTPVAAQNICYDYNELQKNKILSQFIDDVNRHDCNDSFDQLIATQAVVVEKEVLQKTTKTVKYHGKSAAVKKSLQPTQEVDNEVRQLFFAKSKKEVENVINEMEKLKAPVEVDPVTKTNIQQAVVGYRASKERFKTHANEHIKLLKRLHNSKRTMMQLYDDSSEKIREMRTAIKQGMAVTRQKNEEKLKKLYELNESVIKKQDELKKEVWQEFLDSIATKVQSVLQSHI